MLQEARRLYEWGFNPLPAWPNKLPAGKWKPYQTRRVSEDDLERWFSHPKVANACIVTGAISGVAVLDIDSAEAHDYWYERIGEAMDATACLRTPKAARLEGGAGYHYFFDIRGEKAAIRSRANHRDGVEWDLKAEGAITIVPPSPGYEWVRTPDGGVEPLPEALRYIKKATDDPEGGQARSQLAHLLSRPPVGEGGRNVWLAKVAGHYAKHFRTMRDAYEQHVHQAAGLLDPPLPEHEIVKMLESIWTSEHEKPEKEAVPENGWLIGKEGRLYTQIRMKDGEEWVFGLQEYGDFDLVALGVVEDDEAERSYDLEVHRGRQGDVRRALLPGRVLSDSRRLRAWLMNYGVTIVPPDAMYPRSGGMSERLGRYLESQNPESFSVVPHLGWSDAAGGFLTHDGLITKNGVQDQGRVRPDPRIRKVLHFNYGFDTDEHEAREALREVLTFHHSEVASVFGSWWAASLVKPLVMKHTSLFPLMALEAPSESGKTTGMFSLMVGMAGNQTGQSVATRASLRDMLAAHSSGIVWVDDPDNVEDILELLRAATGDGTIAKKGEDYATNVEAKLVAPVLLTGEGLGLNTEKATKDRSITVSVPSPVGRRSRHDRTRPQWDDILAFQRRFPDRTELAGTYVAMALREAEKEATEAARERARGGGRRADKLMVVRVGSRILARLTGDPSHVDIVDRWAENIAEDTVADNTLTLEILPAALAATGWERRPIPGGGNIPDTPVIFEANIQDPYYGVWFNPRLLALWWEHHKRGRIKIRTESASAIEAQARAMGLPLAEGRKKIRIGGSASHRGWYWRLPDGIAEAVVERSQSGPTEPMGGGPGLGSGQESLLPGQDDDE